jgi:hypothetical protein
MKLSRWHAALGFLYVVPRIDRSNHRHEPDASPHIHPYSNGIIPRITHSYGQRAPRLAITARLPITTCRSPCSVATSHGDCKPDALFASSSTGAPTPPLVILRIHGTSLSLSLSLSRLDESSTRIAHTHHTGACSSTGDPRVSTSHRALKINQRTASSHEREPLSH